MRISTIAVVALTGLLLFCTGNTNANQVGRLRWSSIIQYSATFYEAGLGHPLTGTRFQQISIFVK